MRQASSAGIMLMRTQESKEAPRVRRRRRTAVPARRDLRPSPKQRGRMDPYHDRVLERERGAVEDCVAYHGRSFAPAWEGLRGGPVEEVAQLVALNALSAGSTLRSLSSEEGRAELLVEGWPDEELLGFLPLDRDDCDQIWDTYRPIMEHLGLGYAWQRQDDVVRIVVERQSGL